MTSILDMLRAANPLDASPIAPTPTAAPQPSAPAASSITPGHPASPPRPCSCGFRTFWLDPYGVLSCQVCRPPKFQFQVKHVYTVEGEENNYSWSAFSEAQEKIISELVELRTPCGRNVITRAGWNDIRSDNYNQWACLAMEHGVVEADRRLDEHSEYLRKVLHDTGSIDRLPGPWPKNAATGYELAAEEEKPKRKASARSKKK